jgi:hypothetical protein
LVEPVGFKITKYYLIFNLFIHLNISNAFANKWNLKFNPKKSKILITGKKINKEGTWKLGNEPIEETGESSSANKRQFINFDEIFAPILLFSSMFAKSVIKIEKRVGDKAELSYPSTW